MKVASRVQAVPHTLRSRPSFGPPSSVAALLLVATAILVPARSQAELRPLVRDMLENLSAINQITDGVALDDWDQVEGAARGLRTRAISMRLLDLESLHMDRAQDALWDAFLVAQEQAAREISTAVRSEDARAVLQGTQKLVGNACLGCHAAFRDPQSRLRKSVLFMTGFLSAWRDMNRGMMIRDFELIAARAREMKALADIIGSDETLEEEFGLGGPRQRRQFRGFLNVVANSALTIEASTKEQDLAAMLTSFNTMWADGCVACHDKFRH